MLWALCIYHDRCTHTHALSSMHTQWQMCAHTCSGLYAHTMTGALTHMHTYNKQPFLKVSLFYIQYFKFENERYFLDYINCCGESHLHCGWVHSLNGACWPCSVESLRCAPYSTHACHRHSLLLTVDVTYPAASSPAALASLTWWNIAENRAWNALSPSNCFHQSISSQQQGKKPSQESSTGALDHHFPSVAITALGRDAVAVAHRTAGNPWQRGSHQAYTEPKVS